MISVCHCTVRGNYNNYNMMKAMTVQSSASFIKIFFNIFLYLFSLIMSQPEEGRKLIIKMHS